MFYFFSASGASINQALVRARGACLVSPFQELDRYLLRDNGSILHSKSHDDKYLI
jgi:hypothetical protein